ncbi:RING finger protein-like protein [Corynespora cassiicola Philippines]|uniref:RBR-type E3 ubiquitin transferase n=1 Tax=Corynespora cassiicola Philippines TaxID=1448308 RepID=A0A2T2NZ94_CORCC|nr:RING finger protein-like protein [Corynespora cassiicola Philippines]
MADSEESEGAEELTTLQSIFPELVIDSSNPLAASLDLLVAPTKPLPVTFEPEQEVYRLSYLPSLHIDIDLPPKYPSKEPPRLTLSTNPAWLPEAVLEKQAAKCRELWEEYDGMQVLFTYISHLQEAIESAFDLTELALSAALKHSLLEYNTRLKREIFDRETFECTVCLEPKKGSACYRLSRCSHVFCRACLQDFYNNCIQEGDVNNVKCMDPECGTEDDQPGKRKKERLLSPKELLQIPLELETVKRYAQIKRKKKIEADPTIIYCPRQWCQGAMRTDKYPKIEDVTQMDDSDSEADEPAKDEGDNEKKPTNRPTGGDRLAVCEDCKLAFCIVCFASWHGEFIICAPRDKSELSADELASLDFISKNTSACPTCSVPCQKSYGCNHMTCFQCKSHFCYLCSAWLNPDHPYRHFNDPKNKNCFMRLMDMAEGDMAQGEVQFGGRRGAEQVAEFWEREALRMQMEEFE